MKKYIFTLVALVLILIGAVAVKAASSNAVTGWAWSSNIGWISFNSTDAGTGTNGVGTSPVTYNVSVNENGNFSGYGWSSNVGWVSFNPADLAGCEGTQGAVVSTSSGSVTGWVRVVSGKGRTDGWDGCVKLSNGTLDADLYPTQRPDGSRGVSYNTTSSEFKGYGWGSDVLGWLRFSPTLGNGTTVTTVCTNNCGNTNNTPTPSVDLTANPMSVLSGGTTQLSWTSSNVNSCTSSSNWTGSGTSGSATSPAINSNITFQISCIGSNGPATDAVTVTVSGTQPPPTACIQPANSTQCANYIDEPTRRIWNTASQCTQSPTSCEFYCNEGFTSRGGACVKVDLSEQ